MRDEMEIFFIMMAIVVLVAVVWTHYLDLHKPDDDDQGWPTGQKGEDDE